MPVIDAERRFLDHISLDEPWSLVEQFSTMHRWRPEDVNAAADVIAARLAKIGVPHEVYEPELYLSIPLSASVEAGGVTFRAKPPSSCPSVPGGVTGELVELQANPKALRSYNRDIATLFGGSIASVEAVREKVGGKIVVMSGFGNPALIVLNRGVGRRRAHCRQSGRGYSLGHMHDNLGQPGPGATCRASRRSRRSRSNNPDGERIKAMAARWRRARRSGPKCRRGGSSRRSRSRPSGATTPTVSCWCTVIMICGRSASATTPRATLVCSNWRACFGPSVRGFGGR